MCGAVVGWIDSEGAFDPASMAAAGVDLARLLWVSVRNGTDSRRFQRHALTPFARRRSILLKAGELMLDAGGFGLVVIDFGDLRYPLPKGAALRLGRATERSGTAVIALASQRMCGTFAALSLAVNRAGASFSRIEVAAPAIFDGLRLEATVSRNKFGGSYASAMVDAMADPVGQIAVPLASAAKSRPTAMVHHGGRN